MNSMIVCVCAYRVVFCNVPVCFCLFVCLFLGIKKKCQGTQDSANECVYGNSGL